MRDAQRERVYGREEYYWGTDPNDLAEETLEYVESDPAGSTLVDLGAGEGRDAVFFAERGFEVYAVDVSPNGLEKARRLADERGVEVGTIQADLNETSLPTTVDVVYSAGAVQYVEPDNRSRQFRRFREGTAPGGIHVVFAFVDHPEVPTPPDWTENEYFYAPGELDEYYDGWKTLAREELVFEDDSGGEPHEHAAEVLVSRKPD